MNACRPDPAVALATCGPGTVAAPPATNARACYRTSSGCSAPYVAVAPFSSQEGVSDTRVCSCGCAASADGGCTGGTANVYGNDNACSGSPTATLGAGCRPNNAYDRSLKLAVAATPPADAGTCAASSSLTGALTLPVSDIQLCCLPE
jgi:hypothetical protein